MAHVASVHMGDYVVHTRNDNCKPKQQHKITQSRKENTVIVCQAEHRLDTDTVFPNRTRTC